MRGNASKPLTPTAPGEVMPEKVTETGHRVTDAVSWETMVEHNSLVWANTVQGNFRGHRRFPGCPSVLHRDQNCVMCHQCQRQGQDVHADQGGEVQRRAASPKVARQVRGAGRARTADAGADAGASAGACRALEAVHDRRCQPGCRGRSCP